MGENNEFELELAVLKTEYEDKIRKYIASQDLVGRYFITKVETMDSSACVRSEWNDACNTTRFLFNIYKVIEQTEDNVTCRFLKIVDQIEHSFERCHEKYAHKRCLTLELLSEAKIDNLSFGECVCDECDVRPYFKILLDSDVKIEHGAYLFRGDDEKIEKHIKEFVEERNGRNG